MEIRMILSHVYIFENSYLWNASIAMKSHIMDMYLSVSIQVPSTVLKVFVAEIKGEEGYSIMAVHVLRQNLLVKETQVTLSAHGRANG